MKRRILLGAIVPALLNTQDDPYTARRLAMVRRQIEARDVKNPRVLAAMRATPRHLFVPEELREQAYNDHPLPIGHGQTISQPYIVAVMTELLDCSQNSKVLEIGTGSGYQAAVLARVAGKVYTIELVPELAQSAAALLKKLGHENVYVRQGDGYKGWPEEAPFDRILVTAAPPKIPEALVEQLKPGGRMVAPVGRTVFSQELVVVDKDQRGRISQRPVFPVRFVPMVPGEKSQ